MSLPEQLQLKALSEGDITHFEMLFKTYYQPLCNYRFTFLRDKEDAEEIVLKAGAKPFTYHGNEALWTFGYGLGTAPRLSRKMSLNF